MTAYWGIKHCYPGNFNYPGTTGSLPPPSVVAGQHVGFTMGILCVISGEGVQDQGVYRGNLGLFY